MTSSHPLPVPCQWSSWLAAALDRRSAPWLALLFLGAALARGRRTVTAWIRPARLGDQFRPCYTAVAAAGSRCSDRSGSVPVLGGGLSSAPFATAGASQGTGMEQADEGVVACDLVHQVVQGEIHARLGASPTG